MERKPLDKTVLSIHPEKAPPDNNPPPPHTTTPPPRHASRTKLPRTNTPAPNETSLTKKTPVKTLSTNYPIKTTQQKSPQHLFPLRHPLDKRIRTRSMSTAPNSYPFIYC